MAKAIQAMNVHERILAVMNEMVAVKKDGTVAFGKTNYSYTTEAGFIAALRPLMLRYRLTIYPRESVVSPTEKGMTRLVVTYRITASDFPSNDNSFLDDGYIDIQTVGEGADATDKSAAKAMTAAFKYALRQSFLVATGDDAEKTDAQGNKTSSKTPLEQLRIDLTKAGIATDVALSGDMKSAFGTMPRLEYIGKTLGGLFYNTKFDINSTDFDRLVYTQAIRNYIKAVKNAIDFDAANIAHTDLALVLKD